MAENSKISWTTHTFNPWRGCAKVSPGCKHCYAEQLVTKRQGLPLWGVGAERRVAAASTWAEPYRWQKKARAAGERHRVFCASLADVFEPRPDLVEPRRRLFQLIEGTPDLDWLLLTKRPESMVSLASEAGWAGDWPENVWAGTTVEGQDAADERIPHLLQAPARVRFLSCEPLLEGVNLTVLPCPAFLHGTRPDYLHALEGLTFYSDGSPGSSLVRRIDWVIAGGESGPGARLFDLAWARSLRDQCEASGTAFFMKQVGSNAIEGPPELSTRYRTKHPKGGDPAEWPEDLRVQQLPGARP